MAYRERTTTDTKNNLLDCLVSTTSVSLAFKMLLVQIKREEDKHAVNATSRVQRKWFAHRIDEFTGEESVIGYRTLREAREANSKNIIVEVKTKGSLLRNTSYPL